MNPEGQKAEKVIQTSNAITYALFQGRWYSVNIDGDDIILDVRWPANADLSKFLEKYGPNFLRKCRLYKTATLDGQDFNVVGLAAFYPDTLKCLVFQGVSKFTVDIDRLDNFVL